MDELGKRDDEDRVSFLRLAVLEQWKMVRLFNRKIRRDDVRRKQILPVRQKSLRWEAGLRTFTFNVESWKDLRLLSSRTMDPDWRREHRIWRSPVSRNCSHSFLLSRSRTSPVPFRAVQWESHLTFSLSRLFAPFSLPLPMSDRTFFYLCVTLPPRLPDRRCRTTMYSSFVRKIPSFLLLHWNDVCYSSFVQSYRQSEESTDRRIF